MVYSDCNIAKKLLGINYNFLYKWEWVTKKSNGDLQEMLSCFHGLFFLLCFQDQVTEYKAANQGLVEKLEEMQRQFDLFEKRNEKLEDQKSNNVDSMAIMEADELKVS